MTGDDLAQSPMLRLARFAALNDALDMAVQEAVAPAEALLQICALVAAVHEAVGRVVFDAETRHFVEHELPLLRRADVIAAHHAVDDGALHAALLRISDDLVQHLDRGGDVLVVGELRHVGHAAKIVLRAERRAEIDNLFDLAPLRLDHLAVLVEDVARPAADRADLDAGLLHRRLNLAELRRDFIERAPKKIAWVQIKLDKIESEFLCVHEGFCLGRTDNP